jgi:hypothetical protein
MSRQTLYDKLWASRRVTGADDGSEPAADPD